MASPFSHSLSAVVVRSRPLVQLVSSSFLATYHTLFLQWQKIFLVIFIVELLKFPCLLRWVCGGVVDRQWVIARPPWCYHIDLLHILSLIKYIFGDLFGTCWLFVIANISPSFLHPLLMVAILKPSGGGGGGSFDIRHSKSDVLMNRAWFWSDDRKSIFYILSPPSDFGGNWPGVFLCKNEHKFLKTFKFWIEFLYSFSLINVLYASQCFFRFQVSSYFKIFV